MKNSRLGFKLFEGHLSWATSGFHTLDHRLASGYFCPPGICRFCGLLQRA